MTQPAIFASSVQRANGWLAALVGAPGIADMYLAYAALRAVLHQLRDRLTIDEAADLGAQLPLLIRGFYYEGWDPARQPDHRGHDAFIDGVRERLRAHPEVQPETAVAAVFRLLEKNVTGGEIRELKNRLQKEFERYWAHETKA